MVETLNGDYGEEESRQGKQLINEIEAHLRGVAPIRSDTADDTPVSRYALHEDGALQRIQDIGHNVLRFDATHPSVAYPLPLGYPLMKRQQPPFNRSF